jgi:curved DNA-binding protein
MEDYDVENTIDIGFMEAYTGSERQVQFTLQNGEKVDARIKIPAGMDTGKKLRLKGYGLKAPNGQKGDMYLTVQVMPHPDFKRVINDVETQVEIPFTKLCLGGTLDVPTQQGIKQVRIQPATSSTTKMRFRGLGFPLLHSASRGDLYMTFKIKTPTISVLENEECLKALEILKKFDL